MAPDRPISMTTHFLNGDINHTLQPTNTISSVASLAWNQAEIPSETSSFISCTNSSPCKYSEVESLFNALQEQQLIHMQKEEDNQVFLHQRTQQKHSERKETKTKKFSDSIDPSIEHSRSKQPSTNNLGGFGRRPVDSHTDPSTYLSCSRHQRRPVDVPQPFDSINRRLKEINKCVAFTFSSFLNFICFFLFLFYYFFIYVWICLFDSNKKNVFSF